MEIDICRESDVTALTQHKGPQRLQAGPVLLALTASPGLSWGCHWAQARRCGVSSPKGSSSSGNWALGRRSEFAVAILAAGVAQAPVHCPGCRGALFLPSSPCGTWVGGRLDEGQSSTSPLAGCLPPPGGGPEPQRGEANRPRWLSLSASVRAWPWTWDSWFAHLCLVSTMLC